MPPGLYTGYRSNSEEAPGVALGLTGYSHFGAALALGQHRIGLTVK